MSGGTSALQLAILGREDKINKIKLLLQSGANPDQEDDTGNTARTTAVREIMMRTQPANILRELEILFPPSSCIDDFNFTLLHRVILGICPINLSLLIEGHDSHILAQLDAEDQFGITPIQYAAQRDDLSAVRALITAGAKVDKPSSNGRTALWYALKSTGARCVDILLQSGSMVNREDYLGYTPLHIAVQGGHLAATERLISMGADIDYRGRTFGVTPLSFAARVDQNCAIQCLLNHGARVEAVDIRGKTTLCFAVAYNAHKTISLLFDKQANHLHKTNDGSTLLHIAACQADVETMGLLARANLSGLQISCKNDNGITPSELFDERQPTSQNLRLSFSRLLEAVGWAEDGDLVASDEEEVYEDACETLEPSPETESQSSQKCF
jgi:ankyrin repeat protein